MMEAEYLKGFSHEGQPFYKKLQYN